MLDFTSYAANRIIDPFLDNIREYSASDSIRVFNVIFVMDDDRGDYLMVVVDVVGEIADGCKIYVEVPMNESEPNYVIEWNGEEISRMELDADDFGHLIAEFNKTSDAV